MIVRLQTGELKSIGVCLISLVSGQDADTFGSFCCADSLA